jgi:hypothetical protein
MSQPRDARRRRFQFSLRTIFFMLTLLACNMPTVAKHYEQWKETQKQLEADRLAKLRPADFEIFKPTAVSMTRSRLSLERAIQANTCRRPPTMD